MKRFLITCISIMLIVLTIGTAPSYAFDEFDLMQFMDTGECHGCDLSGADLSGQDLSFFTLVDTNLSNADLSGSYIVGSDIVHVNLSGAKLVETEMHSGLLEEIDLTGADLTDAFVDEGELYYVAKLCHTIMPYGDIENEGC